MSFKTWWQKADPDIAGSVLQAAFEQIAKSAYQAGYQEGEKKMRELMLDIRVRHAPIEVSTSQLIEGEIPTCARMKEIMGY